MELSAEVLKKKLEKTRQKCVILEKMIEDSTRDLYQAQETLKSSNAFLNSIFISMSDALRVLDGEGAIQMFNQATLKLLGYTESELLTKSFSLILPTGQSEFFEKLKTEFVESLDFNWITKEKQHVPVLLSSSIIKDSNNVVVNIVLLGKDMREQKQNQAQIMQSNKMAALGEMAGGIAHEVNTPLAVIKITSEQISELLEDENSDKKLLHEMTGTIKQTVERISKIVSGLKNFSRDGSKDPFDEANIESIVAETLSLCGDKFKQHSVNIIVDKLPSNLSIQCRPTQISQVLLNLLNNAHDAIAHLSEKWVRLSVNETAESIEISVMDSGSGVPAKILEKLFQPFFTTKELGKGTGLGLSVSKGLIESHRGNLTLDQKSANTRFVVRLPKRQTNI